MVTATKSIRNTGVIYSVSGSGVEVGKSLVSGSGLISGSIINTHDLRVYNQIDVSTEINIGSPSSTSAKLNISSGNDSTTNAIYVENTDSTATLGDMMVMKYTGDASIDNGSGNFGFGSGASFISFADSNNTLAVIKATSATLADIVQPSDYRLKKDVEDYSGSLDIIKRLQPKKFVWKSSNQPDIGFIAHEIEEAIPQGVVMGIKDGEQFQMIRYNGFVVYLVGAIKEQQQLIEDLRRDVDELKSK
jgi:hypothetical protein